MTLLLGGVLGYVALQLAVGLAVSRRIRDDADYLLAGRRLGYLLATFSIFATWFGAETCIGSAGEIYAEGLSAGSYDPFGYSLCLLLMGLLLAARLWNRGLVTLGDLFRQRYSPGVERLAVLLMVPTSVLWAAAQIRAFGQVLSASSSLSIEMAITLAAAAVLIYTVAGGLLADAVTDILQAGVLILGLGLLFFAVLGEYGGLPAALRALPPERLQLFSPEAGWLERIESWAVPIWGSLIAQELIARVLASRTATVATRACLAATGIYLLVGSIPVFIGLLGTQLVPELSDPEQLLPLVARQRLGDLLYIIFAGALVSAILSTVDSALLAAGGLLCENLVASLRPQLGPVTRLRISRIAVFTCGLVAYGLALSGRGIHDLVEMASSFASAGILIVVLFALFARTGGPAAAYTAMLAATATWLWAAGPAGLSWAYVASLLAGLAGYLAAAGLEAALAASRSRATACD